MKTGRILIITILLASIMVFLLPSTSVNAASKLLISSPDDGDLVSWNESLKISWNTIDNAAGYYVRVKNLETNAMLVDSAWTTSKSYTIKSSSIPHSDAGYRIWVGAVASSSDTASDTFTSDTIEIYIAAEPEISDVYASNTTQTSVVLSMTIDKNNGKSITDYGFYLGTSSKVSSMEKYSYGSTTKGTKTKTITGLTPGTTYYFRAFAENAVGEKYSDAYSFVTAGGKLNDPIITYPIDGNTYFTGSSIKLQWDGVDNADGYTYHIKQLVGTPDRTNNNEASEDYWTGSVSSSRYYYNFNSSNLIAGYWYKFVVEAFADGMDSSYSDYCYIYVDQKHLDDPVISYPVNGNTYPSGSSIKLQWNTVSGADGYRYHIKQLVGTPDPSSNNEDSVNTWSNTTANTYYTLSSGNVKGGYWYKFVVEAYASDAASSYSDYCYVYIEKSSLSNPIVVAPVNTATYSGYSNIKFDWNAVTNADGYNIFIKRLSGIPDRTNDNEPSLASWTDFTASNVTEYSLASSNFVPGYWYKFVVEAYADGFNPSWSEWVYCFVEENHLDDATISTPSNWAEVTAGSSIAVDWNDVSGATGYRCHIKQLVGEPDTGNTNELAANTWREDCGTTSKYTLSASKITTGYWYKFIVEAYSSTASSWSNTVYVYVAEPGSLERPVITSPLARKDYQTGNDIRFTWNKVDNATSYTYYIKQLVGEPDSSDNELASQTWTGTTGASSRRFILSGEYIQPNTWYKFVVQAKADGYDSSWSKYTYIKVPDREDWIYFVLGSNMVNVGEEAFADNALLRTFDASSSNLMVIESAAFKNCVNLKSINLPESVYDIADDAFTNCPNLTIHCIAGSYAESFAISKGIPTEVHGVAKETDILQLSQSEWSIPTVDAAQAAIRVTSSAVWSATSNSSWLTLNKQTGNDGDSVILSVSKNTGSARTAMVTFTCGEASAVIRVAQNTSASHNCSLQALPNFWEPNSDQLTREIVVQSSNGFTVSSDSSWLTYTKNNGTVTAKVTSSSLSAAKTGKLTITCSDCGAAVTVTVSIKGNSVPAPTGLTVYAVDPHAFRVSWNVVSGASYIVERSDDRGASWNQIKTLGVGETSFMDDDNIGAFTSHSYRVYAQKTVSGSTIRSDASEPFSRSTPPEGRISFAGTFGSINEGESADLADLSSLTWNAESGATSYSVSLRNLNSQTAVSGYPKTGLTDRSLSIGGSLAQGNGYVVWVAAYNQYGHLIAQGSKTFYVKNPNAPKPTITINSVSPTSVNNSGNTPFAIHFTATNATSFRFEFDGLQVWEKWDKISSPNPKGESSVWTFDLSEIDNWTVSFYPKAGSVIGNHSITVTAYGDSKQEVATATIEIKFDDSETKRNAIVDEAKKWLSTTFPAAGMPKYTKASTANYVSSTETKSYHGMPYGGNSHCRDYNLTQYSNLTAKDRKLVDNGYDYPGVGTRSGALYCTECVGFVKMCWYYALRNGEQEFWKKWKIEDDTTLTNIYSRYEKNGDYSFVLPGDALVISGHVRLVIANNKSSKTITVIEQTNPAGLNCECPTCKSGQTMSLGTIQQTYSYSSLKNDGYYQVTRLKECMPATESLSDWKGFRITE